MKTWIAALVICASVTPAMAQYEVMVTGDLDYAVHDGVKLTGDLYKPKGVPKAPVIIAVHGGGWQGGSPAAYKHWGPYLAQRGYAMFAIKYRLAKEGTYPKAVYDVKSAIQAMRAKGPDLGLDPERIGLWGDSAGGHLSALVGIAGDQFNNEYRNDPHVNVSASVKTVVSFYGIYDMLAQWQHDQLARPHDQISEKFLGAPPQKNRKIYFESSAISYATLDRNRTRFLLIHGTDDDIVDPAQAQAFWQALNQARIYSRRIVLPGTGHFFASDPFENEPNGPGATAAPRILRFLEAGL